jgi:hypothetical protein
MLLDALFIGKLEIIAEHPDVDADNDLFRPFV